MSVQEPDLVLSGSHLGRGSIYYDKDVILSLYLNIKKLYFLMIYLLIFQTLREFVINTISVTVWRVEEFDSTELDSMSVGQFHSGDSYIIRWLYNVSIQGK